MSDPNSTVARTLLEIESLLLGMIVWNGAGLLLKHWTRLPPPVYYAIAFFCGMLLMYPALASISLRRGRQIAFMKYAAIFFGSAIALMWLHSVSFS